MACHTRLLKSSQVKSETSSSLSFSAKTPGKSHSRDIQRRRDIPTKKSYLLTSESLLPRDTRTKSLLCCQPLPANPVACYLRYTQAFYQDCTAFLTCAPNASSLPCRRLPRYHCSIQTSFDLWNLSFLSSRYPLFSSRSLNRYPL